MVLVLHKISWAIKLLLKTIIQSMWKTTLLLLLATGSLALNSYTHSITNSKTDVLPIYSLGTLTAGDTITFLIEFPNSATGSAPTRFAPYMMDSSYFLLSPQPSGFGNNVSINFGASNTLSWTVSTTADYNFNLQATANTNSLVPFKLAISKGGTQLVKISDVIRVLTKPISVCSTLVFAVVVLIVYKLKTRSVVSSEEVCQSDPSYNSGTNNLSAQTNIKRGQRNSEMIKVELPDSLRKIEGY